MVEGTVDHFEQIDILVNNAATAPAVPWSEVVEANWQHVLDIDLIGAFLWMVAVLPVMQ